MNPATDMAVTPLPGSLRLPPSQALPRKLVISWTPPTVHVMSFGPSADAPLIAAAGGQTREAMLRIDPEGGSDLIIGMAHFPVTATELDLIRPMFCPRGLRMERG